MQKTGLSKKHQIIRALLASLFLIGFAILLFVPSADLPVPACAFHSLTGYSCLTCGMTRSLYAAVRGDWAASFHYHLFGPAVFVGMFFFFVLFTAEAISGKRITVPINRKIKAPVFILIALIWVLYWGVRLASEFSWNIASSAF